MSINGVVVESKVLDCGKGGLFVFTRGYGTYRLVEEVWNRQDAVTGEWSITDEVIALERS